MEPLNKPRYSPYAQKLVYKGRKIVSSRQLSENDAIVLNIMLHLDKKELGRFIGTNKKYKDLANSNYFWAEKFKAYDLPKIDFPKINKYIQESGAEKVGLMYRIFNGLLAVDDNLFAVEP